MVLAFEAGRKGQIRVNTISAGPLGSRAEKAIGFIKKMITYSYSNAPLQKELLADEISKHSSVLGLLSGLSGDDGTRNRQPNIVCIKLGGETSRRLSTFFFFFFFLYDRSIIVIIE
ncbi:hypothetical protein BHE74_00028371 [Ensete ventricosum]|nr:hypothetical protein BHE74_00028371 [Ensete ventricosum]